MSPFHLATLSLRRRKVPTFITVVSIAISVACAGILLRLYHLSTSRFSSMGTGWEAVVGAKAGGIEILLGSLNNEGPYPDFLPSVLYESLRSMHAVQFEDGHTSDPSYLQDLAPMLYFAKLGGYRAVGTEASFFKPLSFAAGQWAAGSHEVVLGSQVAEHLALGVGSTLALAPWVGEHLGAANWPAKVAGVLRSTQSAWDRLIYASVTDAQQVIAENRAFLGERSIWGEHVLNYYLINLKPGGFSPLQALINKRTVGQVIRVDEEKRKLEELTGAGKSVGLFVSVFVILLSSLSVSSMLITRFEAMSVQLAVLRAIGYSRREISRWLIWEGVLFGLGGCIVGAAIDALGFPLLRGLLGTALPASEIVGSSICESAPVWALAMLATICAIFVPLIRLYRQDVHQALKG